MSAQRMNRVLDAEEVESATDYAKRGGGRAFSAAKALGSEGVIAEIDAAGLRGRGGAGFPTATKWRTVVGHSSRVLPGTVVVNAAEGEPGSFKDRELLLTNPYKVIEGAATAAETIGADTAVIATKGAFRKVVDRLRDAIVDLNASDLLEGAPVFDVVEGPDDYLYGEETALLEVVEGRDPLPRVSPPFRHGLDDVGLSGTSADTELASEGPTSDAAPVLVNNVETLAHVTDILANGMDWFLENGTPQQGGTFLCTISGGGRHAEVVELPVGSNLEAVLDAGREGSGKPSGAMIGVSHPVVPAEHFTRPLGYDGSPDTIPIGSGSFIFIPADTAPIAVVAGASRFLSDASCAQCEPCKLDGAAIANGLDELAHGTPTEDTLRNLEAKALTVADGARCALARQHRDLVEGLLSDDSGSIRSRLEPDAPELQPVEIRPLASTG